MYVLMLYISYISYIYWSYIYLIYHIQLSYISHGFHLCWFRLCWFRFLVCSNVNQQTTFYFLFLPSTQFTVFMASYNTTYEGKVGKLFVNWNANSFLTVMFEIEILTNINGYAMFNLDNLVHIYIKWSPPLLGLVWLHHTEIFTGPDISSTLISTYIYPYM